MSNLQAAPAASAGASAEAADAPVIPITVAMPEIVMPEIVMPTFASELELPASAAAVVEAPTQDAPAPVASPATPPYPYRPPLTPQPEPEIPQPAIVPEIPQPGRTPAPQPVPAPRPAPAPQPAPMPQPYPQPQPTPTPAPGEPAPTATIIKGAPVAQADADATKMSAIAHGVFCAFAAVIAFPLFFSGGIGLLFGIGFAMLAYYAGRKAAMQSTYQAVRVIVPRQARPGETVAVPIEISLLRDLAVRHLALTLTGRERAVRGSGKSRREFCHLFCTQTYRIQASRLWQGGYRYAAEIHVQIPEEAPTSFTGRHNFIEWQLALTGDATPWAPNIAERVPVAVTSPPHRGQLAASQPVYRLPQLGLLNAEIGFTCPVNAANIPIFPIGTEIPYRLRLNPQGDCARQRVCVELAYETQGAGDKERLTVARDSYDIGAWTDDPGHTKHGSFIIVPPPTYLGAHVRIRWSVTVRHEKPWGLDNAQVFEVQVTG